MKTYRIYIRNAMTKYLWYSIGTTRAHNEKEVQEELFKMCYRNPDTEYKFEVQEEKQGPSAPYNPLYHNRKEK